MSKKKKSYIIFLSILILGVIVDLITKVLFANYFETGNKDIVVIPNFFSFTFVKNTGAAFGIFGDSTVALTIVSVVFVAIFVVYDIFYHSDNIWYILGISMLISGAIGNFIDRLFLGYVRDFISIHIFPFVFNVADALITFGVIFFAVYLLFYGFKESKKEDANKKNNAVAESKSNETSPLDNETKETKKSAVASKPSEEKKTSVETKVSKKSNAKKMDNGLRGEKK